MPSTPAHPQGSGVAPGVPCLLPPLPTFPHKDSRVLAGMQARILALLTCILRHGAPPHPAPQHSGNLPLGRTIQLEEPLWL